MNGNSSGGTEDDFPESLTLWRCVGCGAMGNAAECAGTCEFKRLHVVEAAYYADLFEYCCNLRDRVQALREFARAVHVKTEQEGLFERSLDELRLRARALLAQDPAERPTLDDEGDEIWRCASCGQIEAFRDCLGICIRKTGDFVLTADCETLSTRIGRLEEQNRELTAFARQVAWSRAKPGQTGQTLTAFTRRAASLSER